jgi:hypothetical protein
MTISAYQVDSVIKAYHKQNKTPLRLEAQQASAQEKYRDVVTLSHKEGIGGEAYQKISYSLLDVLLKDKR